ncbi:hypothetical protein WN48_03602 [Eufriesea mexicana]|nr:hypothetical protein WN48_03602 [Eufriesea mexicana]
MSDAAATLVQDGDIKNIKYWKRMIESITQCDKAKIAGRKKGRSNVTCCPHPNILSIAVT